MYAMICFALQGGGVKNMTIDERARFSFRLPLKLFDQLKGIARDEGVSINAVILKILWKYFEALEGDTK